MMKLASFLKSLFCVNSGADAGLGGGRRSFRLGICCLPLSLLVLEGVLFLIDRQRWLPFYVGWAVLVAVGAYTLVLLWLLAAQIAGLAFGRRLRRSVQAFVLMALAGVLAFGWLAAEIRRAKLQAEMVNAVHALGGTTFDELTYCTGMRVHHSEPPEPRWARTLMGNEFFRDPLDVSFGQTNLNDAQLAEFFNVPGIERVWGLGLQGTKITDTGLAGICRCAALQELSLVNDTITDAGLQNLYSLSRLRYIDIRNTAVTDQGAQKLQQALPKCGIRR